MLFDNLDDNDLYANDKDFHIKHKNFYITKKQIEILEKYDIDINNFTNIGDLLFDIEEYLNDTDIPADDLEWVSESLSEFNYYNNTNK